MLNFEALPLEFQFYMYIQLVHYLYSLIELDESASDLQDTDLLH